MANETKRHDDARLAVATKCTFCVDRIDAGLAQGQKPGVDPEATPACVNACIAGALAFGDLDDPASNVSQLLAENQHFRMHEELGTGPGFYYLWDKAVAADPAPKSRACAWRQVMSYGPAPWQQKNWDWRAAGNFIGGGAGSGLIVFTALSGAQGLALTAAHAGGLALIGCGLLCVWLEIGRPLRALHVFFNPRTSWMTREAYHGDAARFRVGMAAAAGVPGFEWLAAALARRVRLLPEPHAAARREESRPGASRCCRR